MEMRPIDPEILDDMDGPEIPIQVYLAEDSPKTNWDNVSTAHPNCSG